MNGEKVTADRRLHTGDQIRFGTKGPVVAVEVAGEAPPAAATRLSGATPAELPHKSTTQRIRLEVAKQTQHLRRATVALFGLLIVVAGGYFWQKSQYEAKLSRQRSEMIAQVDSLIGALDTVKVRFTASQSLSGSASLPESL